MNKFDSILKKSLEIPDFKNADVDDQWSLFKSTVGLKDTDLNEHFKKDAYQQVRFMLAFAASMILIFSALFVFKKSPPNTDTLVTQSMSDTLHLLDGSMIVVGPNTTISYYTSLDQSNERKIVLDGDATFDVSKSILPFNIIDNDLYIQVLGTEFSILHEDDHVEIKNISGLVKVTNNLNPEMYKILKAGDILHYKNGEFSNPLDTIANIIPKSPISQNDPSPSPKPDIVTKPEEPKVSLRKFKLESVIYRHLIKLHKKKIKVQKKTKLDMESAVTLDIDQPYEDILKDLKKMGYINYIQGDCPGCFIITAPQDKK